MERYFAFLIFRRPKNSVFWKFLNFKGAPASSFSGSIDKKLLLHLADFGRWGGGGSEQIGWKGKFARKIFFSDIFDWSSKNLWKMISANVKANKNNKK